MQSAPYSSIREIERANIAAGHYFFEPSTKRFFGSRILPTIYAGRFFITSECSGIEGYPRTWSIRMARDSGEIETLGDFAEYSSRKDAVKALEGALWHSFGAPRRPVVEYMGGEDGAPEDHAYWRPKIGDLTVGVKTAKAEADAIAREIADSLGVSR